jgi:hypothetical protein
VKPAGPWPELPLPNLPNQKPWFIVRGPGHDFRSRARRTCRSSSPGSWIVDRGSWIVDRGSWIVDRGSWKFGISLVSEKSHTKKSNSLVSEKSHTSKNAGLRGSWIVEIPIGSWIVDRESDWDPLDPSASFHWSSGPSSRGFPSAEGFSPLG